MMTFPTPEQRMESWKRLNDYELVIAEDRREIIEKALPEAWDKASQCVDRICPACDAELARITRALAKILGVDSHD